MSGANDETYAPSGWKSVGEKTLSAPKITGCFPCWASCCAKSCALAGT